MHFLKVNNLRLDTTSIMYHIKYPPCSFPIYFFLMHKRVFVSLKWFGSFFHKNAPLNIAVFHFVLYLLSLSSCVFSNLCGLFFALNNPMWMVDLYFWGIYIFQPSEFGGFAYGFPFFLKNLVVLFVYLI